MWINIVFLIILCIALCGMIYGHNEGAIKNDYELMLFCFYGGIFIGILFGAFFALTILEGLGGISY